MNKIYFFIQHYPNWKTGGHKYHSILYQFSKPKGYNVCVFGNSRIEDKYFKNKIIRIYYGLLNTFRIPSGSLILMTNAPFLDYILPILINKILQRHKYFFIIHHLVQIERPRNKLIKFLESVFIKLSDAQAAVSLTTRKQLLDFGLINIDIPVFPPGLDLKVKDLQLKKLFPDKHKLLYVGTIEKRKGLLDLIEALKMVRDNNYELNVIGAIKDRSYYDKIMNKVAEYGLENKVNFVGRVEQKILESYYLNSSIFVFPSYWEGYGMVVAEAMSYGLPVLISRIPVFEEIVEHKKEGYLFETGNSKQLSEYLQTLLNDKDKLLEMSGNALKRAKGFNSWEETCSNIMEYVKNFEF